MGPTLGRDDVDLIQRDTLYQGFWINLKVYIQLEVLKCLIKHVLRKSRIVSFRGGPRH